MCMCCINYFERNTLAHSCNYTVSQLCGNSMKRKIRQIQIKRLSRVQIKHQKEVEQNLSHLSDLAWFSVPDGLRKQRSPWIFTHRMVTK